MKNPEFTSIDAEAIGAYDKEVVALWEKYLKKYGITLPTKKTAQTRIWVAILLLLYKEHKGEWIHKDDIGELTRLVRPDLGHDQQIRHLKREGWNLETDPNKPGYHRFYDPYRPSSEWENDRNRQVAISSDDFELIKETYSNRCATCGAEEGKPDVRYGSLDNVVLQKGHRDPAKAGDKDNILPQCQFCNRAYRDDFVFNEKGRVHAVASLRPVRLASAKVKRMIYDFLKEHFGD